jgi:predicted TIM-barrel fold metal-dependent hydrolase
LQYRTIVDCHVHCDTPTLIEDAVPAIFRSGIDRIAMMSYGHMEEATCLNSRANSNPAVLAAKSLYPDRVFAFGGINHIPALSLSEEAFAEKLVEQVKGMVETGYDGVKLIETKPAFYVTYPFRLHEQVFDPFFGALEDARLPVLWHVGDPATFWDTDRVPVWARERGWYYAEGDFPSLESLYLQSQDVLKRHSKLEVIFAHFYFLSDDLGRLGKLFDTFPRVRVDLTPGTEMYTSFSRDSQRARDFFIEHEDRILFGTDTMIRGTFFERKVVEEKVRWMRRFLETSESFEVKDKDLSINGLALPESTLRKIYSENFRSTVGESPRELNREKARQECDRISALFQGDVKEDAVTDVAQEAKNLIAG